MPDRAVCTGATLSADDPTRGPGIFPFRLLAEPILNIANDLTHVRLEAESGHAATGAAAVAAYGACNPDVVTMDVTMPDMDGIAATEKIIRSYPDARIIMVTSHAQQSMVMDALRVGAKGYILKPIKGDKLREMLAVAIAAPV